MTFAAVVLAAVLADPPPAAPPRNDPPRLVILVVIDQCRPDYFERFAPRFEGFFARLRDEGRWFDEGEQHHALTVTAAGHAALGTGRFPAHNGIVGNDFFDPDEGRMVGAANDSKAGQVGGPDGSEGASGGGYSARRLKSDGLGDWWRQRYPAAKNIGISIKPRSAILPLGLRGGEAWWVADDNGALVSSEWFLPELPRWVADFNANSPIKRYPEVWEALLPDAKDYAELGCTEDDQAGELKSGANRSRSFPHSLASQRPGSRTQLLLYSPWGDQLLLDFAERAIEAEKLGADDVPDLLTLGLSSTDLIGHHHGPDSWEVCDQLLRLDRALGDFFDFVAERVGEDHFVMALSSDHGVCPLPDVAKARSLPGRWIDWATLAPAVNDALKAIAPELDGAAMPISEFGIRLDPAKVAASGKSKEEVADALAAALRGTPPFVDARSHFELQRPLAPGDRLGELLRASSDGVRAGELLFVLPEYAIYVPAPYTVAQMANGLATSHGTPWPYDTKVPIAFFGAGITAGHVAGRAWTVDVAPTLATLAGVPLPDGLDGRPLALSGK